MGTTLAQKGKFLASADLRGRYNFTVPYKVRKELQFDDTNQIMSLSFILEPTGEITLGKGGDNVIEATSLSSTFQGTLKKKARQRLQAGEEGTIGFYQYEPGKKVLIEMMN